MPLVSVLDFWKRDRDTAPNLVAWQTLPPRPAQTRPFPDDLSASVKQTLIAAGIHSLYSHQLEAWAHARAGENIILSTGTASGKTLAYNLPDFATLLETGVEVAHRGHERDRPLVAQPLAELRDGVDQLHRITPPLIDPRSFPFIRAPRLRLRGSQKQCSGAGKAFAFTACT